MKRTQFALAVLLVCTMVIVGCSAAQWLTTIDDIISVAAPSLVNILNIISIAKGQPLNATLAAKITTDATTVKTLASDFADASASAAPQACAQVQTAIATYSSDEAQVMSAANVSDPATQAKIVTLSSLIAGTVQAVLSVLPNCATSSVFKGSLTAKSVPIPLKSFIKSYNKNLIAPTGLFGVDAYTKAHQVHEHGKFVRVVSFGTAQ